MKKFQKIEVIFAEQFHSYDYLYKTWGKFIFYSPDDGWYEIRVNGYCVSIWDGDYIVFNEQGKPTGRIEQDHFEREYTEIAS